MTELRVTFGVLDTLITGESLLRATSFLLDPLTEGESLLRATYLNSSPLIEGYSQLRVTSFELNPLSEGFSNLRLTSFYLEVMVPVPTEGYMSTEVFPGFGNSASDPTVPAAANPFGTSLPGLSFDVKKTPNFRTRINTSAAGQEKRNALMEYPFWKFELTYEFLEDSSGANSSLKSIMGFFLSRQGAFDSWLFKDPDDYLCDNHLCGLSDGAITEFPFSRVMGGFRERVGQVDTVNTITVFLTVDENKTIPATPGPYTITVDNAADFVADNGVTKGGTPMTRVTGAPAAGEYSVNEGTGVYTFNATDENDAVVINYRYEIDPADYTVTMPNRLIFDVAPPTGEVSWSGQFYFVCRFEEDMQEYEKFLDQLWNLQSCEFRSLIQ